MLVRAPVHVRMFGMAVWFCVCVKVHVHIVGCAWERALGLRRKTELRDLKSYANPPAMVRKVKARIPPRIPFPHHLCDG